MKLQEVAGAPYVLCKYQSVSHFTHYRDSLCSLGTWVPIASAKASSQLGFLPQGDCVLRAVRPMVF